ncbi:hypothetical protein STENM327S_07611 [Streptomyces tendae]
MRPAQLQPRSPPRRRPHRHLDHHGGQDDRAARGRQHWNSEAAATRGRDPAQGQAVAPVDPGDTARQGWYRQAAPRDRHPRGRVRSRSRNRSRSPLTWNDVTSVVLFPLPCVPAHRLTHPMLWDGSTAGLLVGVGYLGCALKRSWLSVRRRSITSYLTSRSMVQLNTDLGFVEADFGVKIRPAVGSQNRVVDLRVQVSQSDDLWVGDCGVANLVVGGSHAPASESISARRVVSNCLPRCSSGPTRLDVCEREGGAGQKYSVAAVPNIGSHGGN